MTSDRAFVWIWLPDQTEPVVCGRLDEDGPRYSFVYARSYLDRPDAVPIFEPELPLDARLHYPASASSPLPLCIDDAKPDAWGRRLVNHRLGDLYREFPDITYLLESSSDRIGALHFQTDPEVYRPRPDTRSSVEELSMAAERIESGEHLDAGLVQAIIHGTSVGGMRPKALLQSSGRSRIAKFTSINDVYPVIQSEFVAMEIGRRCGLDVAPVELTRVSGRPVLLVDRFDREPDGARRRMVSACTILGRPFHEAHFASYVELADTTRATFTDPVSNLRELFGRISYNILVGNTDDHARNQAAFIESAGLRLTPAYDVCPQPTSGATSHQAMAYGAGGENASNVWELVDHAHIYLLDRADAVEIVDTQIEAISTNWFEVCDDACLTTMERGALLGRQFLNPSSISPSR